MAKPKAAPAAPGTTKVRTTLSPHVVLEVGPAELLDLERQGLIHSREGGKGWRDGKAETVESGVITDDEGDLGGEGDDERIDDDDKEAAS